MTAQGDVVARLDLGVESFVVVLSSPLHLEAGTERIIACPFIFGDLDDGAIPLAVPSEQPPGVLLPELVHWLPRAALGEAVATVGDTVVRRAVGVVTALMS